MPRSRYTSPVHASARFVAQRMLLKPLVWSLTSVTVRGREHLDGLEMPYVVVSNHSSHLDAPLVMGAWPRQQSRYLAANAAADYFFDVTWRKALTALFFNAFPVDRTGLRGRGGMATKLLDDGVPLVIFPEGTRSKDGQLGRFTPGAAALCVSRNVPCVPVALVGAYEAMPKGTNWPRRGRPPVTVNIGAPLRPEPGETVLQFAERMTAAVRALFTEIDKPVTTLTRRQLRGKARGVKRGVNGHQGSNGTAQRSLSPSALPRPDARHRPGAANPGNPQVRQKEDA
ncbi:1-acyl-sn-glycerol-3-phosphate acyltransferase [Friedmanniella endophytica]|uniref:1-acyl-sn-glycerol-3-phosphate acyltransferase n=1 Tax=Microlunatus kandeliicorticis TaxID=1759536 RepID=A0A7W3P5B7_9ACTN|nr:lysophospholipid acyltransferase family protein [Microlunatus kandeliicorticis]MBA8793768.1 1-acyl-sn-glycerol-3-phosphate acyltransferase [Microlunatus kandeliicorticis]